MLEGTFYVDYTVVYFVGAGFKDCVDGVGVGELYEAEAAGLAGLAVLRREAREEVK